ncbi:unnamed protein product [Linum trigynum]|uniref:F-box domain-containing protein n=1 Tax=Linum trigynum TaxID=586398 RepID=A0AAV2EI61_9ROSI
MEAKYTSKIGGSDGNDRLSFLPDQIISHILSFMETKYAVGTAVLSRRLEDLWTRVSNLDLDDAPEWEHAIDEREWQFWRFVDKVLGQHKNLNALSRFRFHVSVRYNHSFEVLGSTSFKRELVFGPPIEEIDINIDGGTESGIPQCLRCIPENFYTLKNLKVAKLSGVVLGAINLSVFLPSVKILQLSHVKMKDFESLGRLISGCPALETLHLETCKLQPF